MKIAIHFLPLGFISCLLLFSRCGPAAPPGIEAYASLESLHQALDAFNDAYARADGAALDKMVATGYLHTNGARPPLDKGEWLQYVATRRKAIDRGSLVVDRYVLLDLKTRLHGNAAALSARIRASGLDENGPYEHEFRATQLWVFEADGWKRAAYHDGQVR
ncbi:MAG: nuclear transport factor 2 family protein [Phaeodactylibacter sp.]|nr:nuclear transport factor 2 family protein [Phaeodactylibacter sp.]